ncbi:MAG: NPXTG-anchored protein [Massilioclostridium sp.]|nr:NPXTG-anchored protein [Massilioclostridium sp.]
MTTSLENPKTGEGGAIAVVASITLAGAGLMLSKKRK